MAATTGRGRRDYQFGGSEEGVGVLVRTGAEIRHLGYAFTCQRVVRSVGRGESRSDLRNEGRRASETSCAAAFLDGFLLEVTLWKQAFAASGRRGQRWQLMSWSLVRQESTWMSSAEWSLVQRLEILTCKGQVTLKCRVVGASHSTALGSVNRKYPTCPLLGCHCVLPGRSRCM